MAESHSIWIILVDQLEHPGKYVVRRHEIPVKSPAPLSEEVTDTLDAARALLPTGLSKAARNECESPSLIEMWANDPWEIRH